MVKGDELLSFDDRWVREAGHPYLSQCVGIRLPILKGLWNPDDVINGPYTVYKTHAVMYVTVFEFFLEKGNKSEQCFKNRNDFV